MGTDICLNDPLEGVDHLSIDLLREWWVTTTQALTDNVGSERALELLTPGFRHHGKAGFLIMANYFHLPEKAFQTIGKGEAWAKSIISGKTAKVELSDDWISWTVSGCCTCGACREACLSYCDIAGHGYLESSDQKLDYTLVSSLSSGDGYCRAIIKKLGAQRPPESEITTMTIDDHHIIKEEQEFWQKATLGENWAIATRAAVEGLGHEKAMAVLRPYMRQSGLSLGLMMKTPVHKMNVNDLPNFISRLQGSFGMVSKADPSAFGLSGMVDNCPFSGSIPEICMQFEAFLDGFCEAVDPSNKFEYYHMMTKGEKTCNWVIRNRFKEKSTDEKVRVESMDDPFKRLANKMIDGEITEEEYQRKMALLKDYYSK